MKRMHMHSTLRNTLHSRTITSEIGLRTISISKKYTAFYFYLKTKQLVKKTWWGVGGLNPYYNSWFYILEDCKLVKAGRLVK